MGTVRPVTPATRATQAQERVIEVSRRRNEATNGGVRDEVRAVARAALHPLMPAHELEPGTAVVEAPRVEPDRIEVAPQVISVTRSAVAIDPGVKTAPCRDARAERRVAVQALRRVDAALTHAVTAGAIADSLQPGVRRGKGAGRQQLGGRHGRRECRDEEAYQSDQ
jgi:hypothetical protein